MKPEKEREKGYENKEKKFITDHLGIKPCRPQKIVCPPVLKYANPEL